VRGIRQVDPAGNIGLISNESHSPYNRPPLSKGLWKGELMEKVWRNTPSENVELKLSSTAKRIDTKNKRVVDDRGTTYSFSKLLLATGGSVRRLHEDMEGIIYFRTIDDYQRLRKVSERGKRFAVIGGGFIGSEIAAALSMNGNMVTMIFPGASIGDRVYPEALSRFLNSYYEQKGVQILSNDEVARVEKENLTYTIQTKNGKKLTMDGVVAGIGIQPNVELAADMGLTIENGIVVNEFLQTSHPDVYAAGDVANFYNPALGKRIRVEHEDNANAMGEAAGRNMAGSPTPYRHLPFFYSDLFDLGYEGVGELDSRLETVEDWKEQFKEGIVYYLDSGRVRGVLLWNTWGQVENARNLIAAKGPFSSKSVKGMLPK
jgi:NADPH-dependent 2,4-dienoyl-CoA reductase/sulfur reductase-like enzyme